MLGDQDALLTARATARCAGSPLPTVSSSSYDPDYYSALEPLSTDGRYPTSARVNDDTGVVFYVKFSDADQKLYYKIISVDTSYQTTFSAETLLYNFAPSTLSGFSVVNLYDDKILLAYVSSASTNVYVVVGTYASGSLTFDTPVAVNSTLVPAFITSRLDFSKISDSRVVLCCKNSDNTKPSVQVIDVSLTDDSISYGAVAKSTTTGSSNTRVSMLNSTKGIVTWTSGISSRAEVFTISGTTITFNGTSYSFPNATQFPGYANYGIGNSDNEAISSSQLLMVGSGSSTLNPDPTLYAPMYMILSENAGVLTSTTVTHDGAYTAPSGLTTYPSVTVGNNDMMSIWHTQNVDPNILYFMKLAGTDTPVVSYAIELHSVAAPASYRQPVVCQLTDYVYLVIVETTISSENIRAFALRAT